MPTIDELKELEAAPTPLFLFECTFRTGEVERWSTHAVTLEGTDYSARLLRHNLFDLRASSEDGFDGTAKVSVTLANADSRYSQVERSSGFKGARLTVQFVFFDLVAGTPASEARVVFRGMGNTPDETTESTLRVTFNNRLNLQRILLPDVRISRRCPWLFPSNVSQRAEAVDGGSQGRYSPLYRCGYAPDQGGQGNLNGGVPFTSCDYTRASCTVRGMFHLDELGRTTGRFGGVEYVPPQIEVRSYGEKGTHLSPVVDNEARYNDTVPIVYGTAWYQPPVVFSRNDGNLTHMEVLLGMGELDGIVTVIVNDVEIPEGIAGQNMTATGWFNVVGLGTRNGTLNPDFADGSGNPLGDPYGSMAVLNVVVPNRISNGQSLAKVQVLVQGIKLDQFDGTGTLVATSFTNNPAWVLLDVLRRSGWQLNEIDLASFAQAAEYCAEPAATTDLYGNAATIARFQCNLVVRSRHSAAEVVKGIRLSSSLMLTYGATGLLTLRVENAVALQQPVKPAGSNSVETLDGGWPAYEFSDGSALFSGILRRANGDPTIRAYSRTGSEVPNRLNVEFQDEFNDYQQDSLSLVEVDDAIATGRETNAAFGGVGLPNFDQATRALQLQLAKTILGNRFVEFETTVRGVGLLPGDLIAITYLKEGWERQPFRVVRIAPGLNYQTALITAQWHDDAWYTAGGASGSGGRRVGSSGVGIPRPLAGTVIDANGQDQFGITEQAGVGDSTTVNLTVAFSPPRAPVPAGAAIPVVNLTPQVSATGGTLTGDQTLYYAVSATDASGGESGLSFVVRAKIGASGDTNSVTLDGLSFSPGSASFNVYRGETPAQLLLIAEANALSASFLDTGLTLTPQPPPDENYDHANFYWRWELQAEIDVDLYGPSMIGNSTLGMLPNDFQGALVRVTRGKGAGQERRVISNDGTTLTLETAWTVVPDATSLFSVVDGTWKFGGVSKSDSVEIEVPGRAGHTVEVSGRSANVDNRESAHELNPMTRWQIAGNSGVDTDVPAQPVFGLDLGSQGTVNLVGIGFPSLGNTHTILAGTLSLYSWDELQSPTSNSLVADVGASDTVFQLAGTVSAGAGTRIQIGTEIVTVAEVSGGDFTVMRGTYGSTPAVHVAGTPVYVLKESIIIAPFAKGFFGSPSSGNYSFPVFLPDVRIGAAEFFVTNSVGDSPKAQGSFGALTEAGLRTLSGGQIALQIEGYLATQTSAVPAVVIEEAHAVRDIFAVLREAPVGGPVQIRLRQDDTEYCVLTIAESATLSNVIDGFGLPPLSANAKLNLDVIAVPGAANTLPGRDLAVTIRL